MTKRREIRSLPRKAAEQIEAGRYLKQWESYWYTYYKQQKKKRKKNEHVQRTTKTRAQQRHDFEGK